MAVVRLKSEADYTFKAGTYGGDKLRVVRFAGTEAISQLFQFSIDLASLDEKIDFDALVGKAASLTIHGPTVKRYVNGVVSVFEQTGKEGKWTLYRVEVVPALWMLGHRYNCRIFQNQPIPDTIKQVLTGAGIPSDRMQLSLKKKYSPRDYCVQYRESDLAFISRLMEEYGLFYFFQHAEDKHVLVVGDDAVVHVPVPESPTLIYRVAGTAGVSDEEHIFAYRCARQIRTGTVTLRDYDFEKPRLNLKGEAQAKNDGKLEAYDYPGEYDTSDEGNGLAKVRLEEIQAGRQIGMGHSDCRRFIPGYRFKLDQHPRPDLNKECLIVHVSHAGSQPQVLGADGAANGSDDAMYQNQFECIHADVPFRAPRHTPRPVIQGPQTAIVVGPQGEEIYTDKYGRVKVQFHWDREGKQDEKSSCWLRVGQIAAGTGWGALFLPRIGQEVVVQFLEGDPDQPIVMGSVYNGDNPTPYPLPGSKTKSTIKSDSSKGGGGSNELRFEDAKGSEEVYLHGQKDLTVAIENNKNQTVGRDETLTVSNNRTKTVQVDESETIGANKTIQVSANHSESIGSNMTLTVGGNRTETVGMADAETIALAKALTIGAVYQVSVGGAMNETIGGAKAEEIGGAKAVVVGALSTEKVGVNKSIDAGGSITEKAGTDIGMTAGNNINESAGSNVNISAGKNMVLNAGDQITIKSGSACITMKSNGDITIKGKNITIKADSDIVLKGQKILQN